MACSVTPLSWGGCLSSLLGKAASSAAGSAFTAIANYFADAAKSATAWLWNAMGQASAVQLGGPGWATDLGITVGLALVVGTGLFLVQVIASAARRDMGGMGRAVRGLFVAFLAGGAAVGITELLLEAADSIANGIMVAGTGSSTWANLGQQVTAISALTTLSPAVMLLLALVVVMASVIVWAALMTRKLLLIVSALFAPIAFAGSLGDITASWVRKWIEFTVALIASKVILVLIFVVGLGVLDNGVGEATVGGGTSGQVAQSATQLVIGCLILCLAGLAPWMAIKLVHFTGDSFHQIHSLLPGGARCRPAGGGRTAEAHPARPAVRLGQRSQLLIEVAHSATHRQLNRDHPRRRRYGGSDLSGTRRVGAWRRGCHRGWRCRCPARRRHRSQGCRASGRGKARRCR